MFENYDDILTVEEACEALRIGYNSMYELLNTGKLKGYRNGRVWRIPKAALVEYVRDKGSQLMDIVAAFGGMQSKDPADSEVQAQVKKLQEFITEHYYNCSKVILNQLGQMYGAGGAFTENINAAGGAGAAEFAQKAIEIYCK